jgi:transposase
LKPRRVIERKRSIDADPAELRALAARQANSRTAKRLRVLALLAEGLGTLDAAARERVNEQSVRNWRARYVKGGIPALLRLPKGRKPWLTNEQAATLAAIIRQRPEISYAELCALVRLRFKVVYTESGLAAFIARELRFMRHADRFWGGFSD